MSEEDRVGLINEIDILKQVDHPNIVKLIDVYEDDTTFSLVLELMQGGEVNLLLTLTNNFCSYSNRSWRNLAFRRKRRRN